MAAKSILERVQQYRQVVEGKELPPEQISEQQARIAAYREQIAQQAAMEKALAQTVHEELPPPPEMITSHTDRIGSPRGLIIKPPDPYTAAERQVVRESGVDVDTGAPKGSLDFGVLAVAQNDSFAQSYASEQLTKYFQQPQEGRKPMLEPDERIDVRMGKAGLEFTNPVRGGKWTTLKAAKDDFSPQQFRAMLLGNLPTIGAGVGSLGFAGGPWLGVPTTAAGAGTGRMFQLMVAKEAGVTDADIPDIVNDAFGTGMFEGMLALAGDRIFKLFGSLGRLIGFGKPRPISFNEADMILEEIEATADTVRQINARNRGILGEDAAEFSPNLGQRMEDADINNVVKEAAKANEETRTHIRRSEREDRQAIDQFVDNFVRSDADTDLVGRHAQQVLRANNEDRLNVVKGDLESAKGRALVETDTVGLTSEGQIGDILRQQADAAEAVLKEQKQAAWGRLNKHLGIVGDDLSGAMIDPTPEVKALITALDDAQKRAILLAESDLYRQSGVTPLFRQKTGLVDDIPNPDADFIDVDGNTLFSLTDELEGPIDYVQVDRSLKAIRNLLRRAGGGDKTIDEMSLVKWEKALKDMRESYFVTNGDADGLALLSRAERMTRRHTKFKNETIWSKFLTKKNTGKMRIASQDVFEASIVNANRETVQELAALAKNSPEARLAIQEGIWTMYRRRVMPNGTPDFKAHKAFMQDYGPDKVASDTDLISTFFDPQDVAKINRFGEFGRLIDSKREALKRMETLLSAKTGRHGVVNMNNPSQVARTILMKSDEAGGQLSIRDVVRLRQEFTRAGLLRRSSVNGKVVTTGPMADALRYEIYRQISSVGDRISREKLFSSFLKNEGRVIRELLGDSYWRDLKLLDRALRLKEPIPGVKAGAVTGGMQISLLKAMQIGAPPLSTRGRVMTFARQLRTEAWDEVLYNILSDPAKLRKFLELRNADIRSQTIGAFLASVGGSELGAPNQVREMTMEYLNQDKQGDK